MKQPSQGLGPTSEERGEHESSIDPNGEVRGARDRSRGLLKDRAYAELKGHIIWGDLTPGTFLSERQLSSRLAMSKTPIRAAVERLEFEGFVTVAPQQGIVVREPSLREIADQFEIRAALEAFVLRNLAGRLEPDQVQRLEVNLEAQRENIEAADIRRAVLLDTEFHILLCEFAENQEILRVMGHLRDKVHRVIQQVYERNRSRFSGAFEEHRAIADAVIEGNASLAARRIEEHLEFGKQDLLTRRRSRTASTAFPPSSGHDV